jgi:hypothetical protein
MRRPNNLLLPGLLTLMALVLAAIALSPAPTEAAPSAAPNAQNQQPVQFYTRTLTTVSPAYGSGNSTIEWLQASGDWVAYGVGSLGCGHCGTQTRSLTVQNVISTTKTHIRGSYWSYQFSSGGAPVGIHSVKFTAPYLVWVQPGKNPPSDGHQFAAGTYDCVLCYYNVDTGKGGSIQTLSGLAPDDLNITVAVLDVTREGQILLKSTASADLIVGNITSGAVRNIPANVKFEDLREGTIGISGRIVWISAGNVFTFNEESRSVQQIGTGADGLRGHAFYIFWHTQAGLQLYDGLTARTVLPGVTSNYDANTTTDLGDITVWVESAPANASTIKLSNINIGGGSVPLLSKALKGSAGKLSMAGDKLVYVETEFTPSLPFFHVQLVWLVRPDPAFPQVWSKADGPVASGKASRSWLWGPQPNNLGKEAYVDGPNGQRLVQYYDKSRMEVNNPNANPNDPFYVTNGLLVTEMIAKEIQLGNSTFISATVPATIPVAGDPRKDNPLTPGYAALGGVSSLHGENTSPGRVGQQVNQALEVNGVVSVDTAHAQLARYTAFVPQTGHNIPDLFWNYLQRMQGTYGFDWTFVLGYPISEAYWTQMRVSGKDMPVMIQAYQRRVLTYVPDFPSAWRVQMGNVGQHYFEWRYIMNNEQAP